MAAGPFGPGDGSWQIRHLPGAQPSGSRAGEKAVRNGGISYCGEAHQRSLVSTLASGESGRQHAGCRRYRRKRKGFWPSGQWSGRQCFPQDPLCGVAGERDSRVVVRRHGQIRESRDHAGPERGDSPAQRHVVHGRPFFPSYKLWRATAQTGADLLWRVRRNARLDVEKRLGDGSYLSRIYANTTDRRKGRNGILVRVIEYRLKDVKGSESLYRLITTILVSS